ncbi:phospholipid scramblase 3-like [Ornithodoros turicata]|uniref:phospholipid scramblase 3-like n=1 Tax=Ornithodoros turicata TaxID=34597 RepID=UPI003138E71E
MSETMNQADDQAQQTARPVQTFGPVGYMLGPVGPAVFRPFWPGQIPASAAQGQPIQQQPVPVQNTSEPKPSLPRSVFLLPPGDLTFLDDISGLIINVSHVKGRPAWFAVRNSENDKTVCYFKIERVTCESLCCCANSAAVLTGVDTQYRRVLDLYRPFRCQSGVRGYVCCGCSRQEMRVSDAYGNKIGFVFEDATFWRVSFSICDASRKPFLKADGPCFYPNLNEDSTFQVQLRNLSGEVVGYIKRETRQKKEIFVASFPKGLSSTEKACVLSCAVLSRFMVCDCGHVTCCFVCSVFLLCFPCCCCSLCMADRDEEE